MSEQDRTILETRVSAVTVYTDRASVTRTAKLTLTKGEHTCLFDRLPASTEPNSVQVNGTGNVMLKGVQFKREFYAEIPDDIVKVLYDRREALEDETRVIQDKFNRIEKEREFVNNITNKLTAETEELHTSQLDPDKWVKMVEFYRNKLASLDDETRSALQEMRRLDKENEKINQEIYSKGHSKKERKQVEIVVEAREDGDVTLELSYIVYGPSWRPFYDLRVNSDTKTMGITYNANIRQNTGEDWNDVSLQLSTAQANISGQQPEMAPWHLVQVVPVQPVAASPFNELDVMEKTRSAPSPRMEQMMAAEEMEFDDSDVYLEGALDDLEMVLPETTVETKATSVVFNIAGNSNVVSDNTDHKSTILIEDFPARFRYSCVPKLTPYAYLKAEVTNTTDYPFLAGETNIFLDNNFVANGQMKLVATTEKFWTSLGIDEAMKVEHKFLKRHAKQAGMFNKTNSYTYEYLIEVTNNKKTQEELVIWDQLPISNHDKIEVKLISPEYKEDTETFKMNEYKYMEWLFKPQAGEKVKVPLKFSVEYPVDMVVSGL